MRKLHLNTDDLRVESFTTTDAGSARHGTVHARSGTIWTGGLDTCSTSGCDGYSSKAVFCFCDTTYTQREPECDPSAYTLCVCG